MSIAFILRKIITFRLFINNLLMTAKEFLTSLPEKVPTNKIEGIDTLFHFDISGDGGGQYSIKVKDQNIEVQEGLIGEAKCEIKATNQSFVSVLKGELNPMMAVLMGKIKISDKEELIKNAKVFGLM